METTDILDPAPAPSGSVSGADALAAALQDARDALLAAGFTTRDQYTSSGSHHNRVQHLDAACTRLRSARPVTVAWKEAELEQFLPSAQRRGDRSVCNRCQSTNGSHYAQLLAQPLWDAVRRAEQLHARCTAAGLEHRPADGGYGADGHDTVNFVALHEHLAVVDRLVGGVTRLFDQAARPSHVDDLSTPLAACATVATLSRRLFDQLAQSAPEQLDIRQMAKLAAGSAAQVTGSYSLNVNRKGRDLPALVSHQSQMFTEPHRKVQDVFADWVKHCVEHPDQAPFGWRPQGATAADLTGMDPTTDALSSVSVWHEPPDPARTPWELLLDNWQRSALADLNTLLADWCTHYTWVNAAPDITSFVLVLDERHDKLANLHLADRFDLLDTVLSGHAPQPSAHDMLWTAQVPTAVARALDGYTSASGHLQAASLEGLDPAKLDEALTLTLSFRETFAAPQWLSASAQAAVTCLA